MPKSAKPRKKYVPKLRAQPITMRFSQATELKLQLVPHEALRSFKEGRQEESDWHTLAARVNLGSTLAHIHFGEDSEAKLAMNDALEALRTSWARYQRLGKMGMTGEEYNHIALALTVTDDMQKLCTRRELDAAMTKVFRDAAIFTG